MIFGVKIFGVVLCLSVFRKEPIMMKQKRILIAMLVLVLFLSSVPAALAASGAATMVPTLKFTNMPRRGIESGHSNDIGINASVPGFLRLWLEDQGGSILRTYCENAEIHTKINFMNVSALDDQGNAIPEGTYVLKATMVNQFGVESTKPATYNLKVRASEDFETTASGLLTAEQASSLGYTPGVEAPQTAAPASQSASTDVSAGSQAQVSTQPAQIGVTSDLTYGAGNNIMIGVEGFQIGIGVKDRGQNDGSYWSLTSDSTDAEIWAAIVRPITSVNMDEKESTYIYDSPHEDRKQIGTVSGLTQGLHVLMNRTDGWSLVEAYRNEDSAFVRGYIKTSRLKTVEANTNYGIVIDKATQTLFVYKDGQRIGSCLLCSGLATSKYLARETPAGEFITATRRGTIEYYNTGEWCKYAIRINGNYSLCEIPTTRKGGSDYSPMLALLGMKSTRGNIVVAHDPSVDGGINAEWIWNMTDKNKRVKVLILDDKDRSSVPVSL